MASTFAPPPGVTPDPDHPAHTLFPEIVATVTISLVLNTTFTAARLIAKRTVSRFNVEDYLSIITWFMFVAYATVFTLQGVAGIGRHIWQIQITEAPTISKLSWAIELMYCFITWFAKAALLLQIQRTFAPHKKGAVYIASQTLIWANLAFYGSAFIALTATCVPTQKIWNPKIIGGKCINTGALLVAMGIINVVSDLLMLCLPIWAIWHLRMALKMKLGVSAIFSTGLFAFACSICRLIYTFPPLHSEDSTYLFAPVGLWSIAEITSIILCTCFPLMPRFVRVITGRTGSDQRSSQPKQYASEKSSSGPDRKSVFRSRCKDCKRGLPCILHTNLDTTFIDGNEEIHEADQPATPKDSISTADNNELLRPNDQNSISVEKGFAISYEDRHSNDQRTSWQSRVDH